MSLNIQQNNINNNSEEDHSLEQDIIKEIKFNLFHTIMDFSFGDIETLKDGEVIENEYFKMNLKTFDDESFMSTHFRIIENVLKLTDEEVKLYHFIGVVQTSYFRIEKISEDDE